MPIRRIPRMGILYKLYSPVFNTGFFLRLSDQIILPAEAVYYG